MSPEDQKAFETLFDLFNHPGWDLLVEELEDSLVSVKDIMNSTTVEELFTNQGKASVLQYIINLSETTEEMYQQALRSDNDML